jgi:hypothetical protein
LFSFLISYLLVFVQATKERTILMKKEAVDKAVFNAAKFDKILSESYGAYKRNIREGRADLRVLRNDSDYHTDSSEAQEVKETISFFKKQVAAVVEQIENMKQKPSSITMTAATGEPTATASTLSSQSQSRSQSPSPFAVQASSPILSPFAQSPFGKSLGPGSDSDDDLPASSGLSKAANDGDENKEE